VRIAGPAARAATIIAGTLVTAGLLVWLGRDAIRDAWHEARGDKGAAD
jgi:hypothetical protein